MENCPYSFFEYSVEKGDTFASLARKFSVSQQELNYYNKNINMAQGEKLKIPCKYGICGRGFFYEIKRSDTLYRIAKRNKISLEMLLEINPYLNPSYYVPGQVIVLPYEHKATDDCYTLGENEGLVDVLCKYNMDVSTFCSLNPNVSPMEVRKGQRVNVVIKQKTKGKSYKMKPGDTLVSVANKFGIKVSTLLAENKGIRPSEFVEGVNVRLPDG